MTRTTRRGVAGVLAIAIVAALTSAPVADAAAASYRATFSAKQELTWKVDGTTTGCEVRRGTGSGRVAFKVRSLRAAPLTGSGRNGLALLGSIPSVAKGSIAGSFADTAETACPGFDPGDAVPAPADGCGPLRFGIRVDLTPRRGFVHVTGPAVPLGPVSISQAPGDCPFPIDSPVLESTDLRACGDGNRLWERSWGVASSGGRGLFAGRMALGGKRAPRVGRTRQLTGRARVDCTVPSQYSGGVKFVGELTWTVSVKRVR